VGNFSIKSVGTFGETQVCLRLRCYGSYVSIRKSRFYGKGEGRKEEG
jgi:hypothetical protein